MPIEIELLLCDLSRQIYELELKKQIRIYLPSEYKVFENKISQLRNTIKILKEKFE